MKKYIKISIEKNIDGVENINTEAEGLSNFELMGLIKQFTLQLELSYIKSLRKNEKQDS